MSDRSSEALRCVRNHVVLTGSAPSVRELARLMGFRSPRSAAVLLDELVRSGALVKRLNGRIQLAPDTAEVAVPTVDVPLVGAAPCGNPLLAEERIEGYFKVDTRLARPPHRYYILRGRGDSMDCAGIDDGDLVLVRSTPDAADGDRVVALVDGEVTIKVLRRGSEAVALEPRSSNPEHRPIYAATELQIQGVVVARLPTTTGSNS